MKPLAPVIRQVSVRVDVARALTGTRRAFRSASSRDRLLSVDLAMSRTIDQFLLEER
jgi:hypothetical protein